MKIQVSMDRVSTIRKPEKTEGYKYGEIRKRAADNWTETELFDFADFVGNKGYAFIPGHLSGGVKADCCTEQQIFALDFDEGVLVDDIRARAEEMDLSIAVIYNTLSHVEGTSGRFRVIFIMEKPIRDFFEIKTIICMLLQIFPEADKACKDLARVFLGGKKLLYIDETARFDLVYLINSFRQSLDRNRHYRRNAESFSRDTGVLLWKTYPMVGYEYELNTFLEELGENVDVNLYNYIYRLESNISPVFLIKDNPYIKLHQNDTCKSQKTKKNRRLSLDNVSEKCRLLDEFYSGEALSHEIRFAIARSLIYINGGRTKFLDTIRQYHGEKKYNKWIYDIKVMQKQEYRPSKCESFCPYFETCRGKTIIDALSDDHKIYILEKEDYVPVEEAEQQFYSNLKAAMDSEVQGLHLIRGQTGLGKTEMYIRLVVEHPETGFVIAVPTNNLKEEIYQRMLDKGISEDDIFVTPTIRGNNFVPLEEQEMIIENHNQGFHHSTKSILKDLLDKISKESLAQRAEIKKIMAGIGLIQGQRIIITTHAYFQHMSKAVLFGREVIIDEDILQQYFKKTFQIDSESLRTIKDCKVDGYWQIAEKMLRTDCEKYMTLPGNWRAPMSEEELKRLQELGCTGNYNDLNLARAFIRHKTEDGADIFQYFAPSYLPCSKAIILSATLNPEVYRKYFYFQQVITYPEKTAEYQGKIEQYSYYSLGRRDLGEKQEAFAFAKAFFNDVNTPVITFKKFTNYPIREDLTGTKLHFGNTMGIDSMAGKDLAVVGTPFNHPDGDKLVAVWLGADVNSRANRTPARRRIEYAGRSFVIPTYKDSILREIQLYGIQTELEQSVGRARLLRNNATVLVLSAFPVFQARTHEDRYLERKFE